MANERYTDLPVVSTAELTDIICAVQGYVSPSLPGTSNQETLQQVYDLFQSNIILYNAGNPNGVLTGKTYQLCWDTINHILWVCTTTGTSWTKSIELVAGAGVTIEQAGSTISISASASPFAWNEVTTDTSMVSNNGYGIVGGTNVNLLLPATSFFGDEIKIVGNGGGLWTVTQNSGQIIYVGSTKSTIGSAGSLSATDANDSCTLVCMQDNLTWTCLGAPQGNLNII